MKNKFWQNSLFNTFFSSTLKSHHLANLISPYNSLDFNPLKSLNFRSPRLVFSNWILFFLQGNQRWVFCGCHVTFIQNYLQTIRHDLISPPSTKIHTILSWLKTEKLSSVLWLLLNFFFLLHVRGERIQSLSRRSVNSFVSHKFSWNINDQDSKALISRIQKLGNHPPVQSLQPLKLSIS